MWTATRFPDAFVLEVPMGTEPIEHACQVGPQIISDRLTVFVVQIDRIHQLAVDVELQLAICLVANAYGRRLAVALEVREGLLAVDMPPINAIHDL